MAKMKGMVVPKAAREFEIQEREIPHPGAERSGSKRRCAESVTAT